MTIDFEKQPILVYPLSLPCSFPVLDSEHYNGLKIEIHNQVTQDSIIVVLGKHTIKADEPARKSFDYARIAALQSNRPKISLERAATAFRNSIFFEAKWVKDSKFIALTGIYDDVASADLQMYQNRIGKMIEETGEIPGWMILCNNKVMWAEDEDLKCLEYYQEKHYHFDGWVKGEEKYGKR